MSNIANSIYKNLKRQGLHNWGFLNLRQSDFDFNDLDDLELEFTGKDSEWLWIELEE